MSRWQIEDPPATFTAPWPPPGRQEKVPSRFGWLLKPSVALVAVGAVVAVVLPFTYNNMSTQPVQMMALGRPAAPATEAGTPIAAVAGQISLPLGGAQPTIGPSIARTARLRLSSRDFEGTRRAVERIAGDLGGWFSRMDVSRVGEARSLTAAIQVPAPRLDAALAALKPLGIVLDESQKGEDVTEQIVDVDARLSNARNTEKRLVDLLQRRTGELEHVLAAEREISRVREEIERFDAQRKNLDRRVTYATLTVEVIEEIQASINLGPRPVPGRFRDALVTGLTEAMDSALGLTLLVIRLAPTLLLWAAVLFFPVRALVRRSRRLNPEPS